MGLGKKKLTLFERILGQTSNLGPLCGAARLFSLEEIFHEGIIRPAAGGSKRDFTAAALGV